MARPKGSKNKLSEKLVEERKEGKKIEEPTVKFEPSDERKGKLNDILRDLNKKFGKDSIKYANAIEERERIPFKNSHLTTFTNGGVPRGTYTCIWGSKGCAKTTIALDLVSVVQAKGGTCVYINGERSYDPVWAKKRGVDTEKLVVVDVETIEDGLDTVIKLCREKVADLIIFDSLHGLAPKGELYEGKALKEKSVSQDTMALRARKLTQFFEMATPFVANSRCAIVLIGQARTDLGGFIKIETLTGGHALVHNSRLILRVRRGNSADAPVRKEKVTKKTVNDEGEEIEKTVTQSVKIGFDLVVHCTKSQISGIIEGQEIHLPFLFEKGLDE